MTSEVDFRNGLLAGIVLMGVLVFILFCAIGLSNRASTDQVEVQVPLAFEKGRCVGWADAHGRVAAWDDNGDCVLGEYPAQAPEAPVAEVQIRLDAYVEP